MQNMIEANMLAFALALIIGLLVAWWLFRRTTRDTSRTRDRRPDVLDEGAAPAQRNQALIDAPSATAASGVPPSAMANAAASVAAAGPDILVGMGEVASSAVVEEIEAAQAATPQATPAPAPASSPATEGDDLSRIKGVGPKLVALLHSLGVTRYAQISEWTDADVARIDAQLGAFAGRPVRDSWVEQARFLASDDTAGFEGKFGKL